MALNEIFFKVTIASSIETPMNLDEFRRFPVHEIHLCEYEEKLVNIMVKPAQGFDKGKFIKFMKKRLMKIYDTPIVEHFEKVKLIK